LECFAECLGVAGLELADLVLEGLVRLVVDSWVCLLIFNYKIILYFYS